MHELRSWVAASILSFGFASSVVAQDTALLDEMFQDHAVLQRDRPVPIWGQAKPNSDVVVLLLGRETSARADENGAWRAELPAMPAGGPHELSVRSASGEAQTLKDVLIGDVWICSGQSNMEFSVRAAMNGWGEISRANHDSIRLLSVEHSTSFAPRSSFATPVKWQVVTPQTIPQFSAVCYFYARELQKVVNVPMGLIHTAWGGSKIEPWMSIESLRAVGGLDDKLDILSLQSSNHKAAIQRWGQVWQQWWESRNPGTQPWTGRAPGTWVKAPPELSHWETWGVEALAQFNGMVWLRANVELTAKQARQPATLALGKIDDVDMSWLNGKAVGSISGPDTQRNYVVEKGMLRAGVNTIVINALDLWAFGGVYGPSESRALKLQDGTVIPLDGRWEYQIVPTSTGQPPRAPWDATAGLAVIGNAMIAPLGEYRARGVLWYQGESNTDEPQRYRDLLKAWMKDWRARFGEEAAFLIVQLANFGPAPTQPIESGWAGLRESQRLAVNEDGNAGLAVTIDLGDRYDIHPANKQQVGIRLARAARHVVYGEALAPSGPVPVSAKRNGDAIVVSFDDVEQGLVAYSAAEPIGFELCGAEADSCRYVRASIDATSVRLSAAKPTDSRVRFCWADSPVCTLYDGNGLPAGPFELSIE
jgi:sialate O-acetylesterase